MSIFRAKGLKWSLSWQWASLGHATKLQVRKNADFDELNNC